MSHLLIKKEWTRESILDAHEAGGRKRGRAAGGWVDDLAAQKKVITLCPLCTGKFNPGKVGYRKEKELIKYQMLSEQINLRYHLWKLVTFITM